MICILALTTVLLFIGIVLLIVSHIQLKNCREENTDSSEIVSPESSSRCDYSPEARRVGLGEFLEKVKESYYEVFPEDIAFHPVTSSKLIKEKFRVHDPRPENIKRISDRADELLRECVALVSCLLSLLFFLDLVLDSSTGGAYILIGVLRL